MEYFNRSTNSGVTVEPVSMFKRCLKAFTFSLSVTYCVLSRVYLHCRHTLPSQRTHSSHFFSCCVCILLQKVFAFCSALQILIVAHVKLSELSNLLFSTAVWSGTTLTLRVSLKSGGGCMWIFFQQVRVHRLHREVQNAFPVHLQLCSL